LRKNYLQKKMSHYRKMDHLHQNPRRKNRPKEEAHQINQRNVILESRPDIFNPIFKFSQHQGVKKFSSRGDLTKTLIIPTAVALPQVLLVPRLQLPKKYS
jgi:hypothetical protein